MATATAADELLAGRKTERLEAAITSGLDAEIRIRAQELAGEGNDAKMFRSAAARDLLVKGVLAERMARAKRVKA